MKFYFDSCCYNRPYDDQTQGKIHLESEIILAIIKKCQLLNYDIVGSAALGFEINQIPDIYKKEKVRFFYEQTITEKMNYNQNVFSRVKELRGKSTLRTFDLFHLAFAESASSDMLLTTDSQFERASSKLNLEIKVVNPINCFTEVFADDYS